jgi:hypothetical protein
MNSYDSTKEIFDQIAKDSEFETYDELKCCSNCNYHIEGLCTKLRELVELQIGKQSFPFIFYKTNPLGYCKYYHWNLLNLSK